MFPHPEITPIRVGWGPGPIFWAGGFVWLLLEFQSFHYTRFQTNIWNLTCQAPARKKHLTPPKHQFLGSFAVRFQGWYGLIQQMVARDIIRPVGQFFFEFERVEREESDFP